MLSKPGIGVVKVTEVKEDGISSKEDLLALEEPLEIRVGYGLAGERYQKSLAVAMRCRGAFEFFGVAGKRVWPHIDRVSP